MKAWKKHAPIHYVYPWAVSSGTANDTYVFVYQFGCPSIGTFFFIVSVCAVVDFIVVVDVICCRLFTIWWYILFPDSKVTKRNYLLGTVRVATYDSACMAGNAHDGRFRSTMFCSFWLHISVYFYYYSVTWCICICVLFLLALYVGRVDLVLMPRPASFV